MVPKSRRLLLSLATAMAMILRPCPSSGFVLVPPAPRSSSSSRRSPVVVVVVDAVAGGRVRRPRSSSWHAAADDDVESTTTSTSSDVVISRAPSLNGKAVLPVGAVLAGLGDHKVPAVYAILENYERGSGEGWENVVRVGVTRDLTSEISDFRKSSSSSSSSSSSTFHVRAMSFSYPQRSVMEDFAETWRTRVREAGGGEAKTKTTTTTTISAGEGNLESYAADDDDEDMDDDDLDDYLMMMAGSRAAVPSSSSTITPPLFVDDVGTSGISSLVAGGGGSTTMTTTMTRDGVVVSPFEAKAADAKIDHRDYEAITATATTTTTTTTNSPAEDMGQPLDLTIENVDAVLDEVRPYLISDGGNVSVRGVDDGDGKDGPRNVYLLLEGACGSCASSTVTMKMGIERVLRERFGEALGEVKQVDPESGGDGGGKATALTTEAVRAEVDRMSRAITAMGGVVRIADVDSEFGVVTIDYRGPNRVRRGLELALLDVEYVRHVKFVS
ncbi:hypothetical protein ACHAW5_008969 [Stephanodiscus triporus]|uniref:NIF system FeS cluster assembly NifU C-terminal domain-containing protein n=1 Tax=Stephanodiscus triporus TaxID=2934178 RepID=A0ABD3NQJ0_9STRA